MTTRTAWIRPSSIHSIQRGPGERGLIETERALVLAQPLERVRPSKEPIARQRVAAGQRARMLLEVLDGEQLAPQRPSASLQVLSVPGQDGVVFAASMPGSSEGKPAKSPGS
jgi:hypothetical protein